MYNRMFVKILLTLSLITICSGVTIMGINTKNKTPVLWQKICVQKTLPETPSMTTTTTAQATKTTKETTETVHFSLQENHVASLQYAPVPLIPITKKPSIIRYNYIKSSTTELSTEK